MKPTERIRKICEAGELTHDHAINLATELERVAEQLEIEQGRETCNACSRLLNPSLIESGTCIFCLFDIVKEQRDGLTAENANLKRQVEGLNQSIRNNLKAEQNRDMQWREQCDQLRAQLAEALAKQNLPPAS